jgi:hypothetical protein
MKKYIKAWREIESVSFGFQLNYSTPQNGFPSLNRLFGLDRLCFGNFSKNAMETLFRLPHLMRHLRLLLFLPPE